MIYPVIGNIGSGKSIFLAAMGLLKYCSGYEIYTNFTLRGIPTKRIFDVSDFSQIKADNIAVFIDEVQLTADARRSGSNENIIFSKNMTQSRKWGEQSDVFISSQSFFFMDTRLRTLTDTIFETSIISWLFEGKIINTDRKPGKGALPLMLRVKYVRMGSNIRTIRSFKLPLLMGGIYVPSLYDTMEMMSQVGDRKQITEIEDLINKYRGCGIIKKTQIVSYMRRMEGLKNHWITKEDAGIAADNILLEADDRFDAVESDVIKIARRS